jgi:hypothetical protein
VGGRGGGEAPGVGCLPADTCEEAFPMRRAPDDPGALSVGSGGRMPREPEQRRLGDLGETNGLGFRRVGTSDIEPAPGGVFF